MDWFAIFAFLAAAVLLGCWKRYQSSRDDDAHRFLLAEQATAGAFS